VTVFDSNAILLYLADRAQKLVPGSADTVKRGEMLSWLMFIATGLGPFSGQSVHFRHVAPEPKLYALNRYDFEANRHWRIIEHRLHNQRFMLGDDYSIVDIALWGWARMLPYVLGGTDTWDKYPAVKRFLDTVSARPAAVRAEALKTRHAFKAEMDDAAKRYMFPANERIKDQL
jgi:GST-like protein